MQCRSPYCQCGHKTGACDALAELPRAVFDKVIHMSRNNNPKPKPTPKPVASTPVEPVEVEAVPVYDAVLEPLELAVEVEETIEEPVEEIVELEVVAPKPATSAAKVPATTYAVVGNGSADAVYASKAIFQNRLQKKSLTVHHLQRRLAEWGHAEAYSDVDGWYGEPTKKSVAEFQEKHGLEATGIADYETLARIFEGDTNVKLVKE